MSKANVKSTIDRLFTLLERAAESSTEHSRLLQRAYESALEGERRHRSMGRGLSVYTQSAATAARYFVVKWYNEPGKVTNALEAASLRDDCLYASALRVAMPGCAEQVTAIADIDYTSDIVSGG